MDRQERRILLLGAAGNTGSRIARFLLRQRPTARLVLAGRRSEPLEKLANALAGEYPDSPCPTRVIDVSNEASLRANLDDIGLAIVASSTSEYVENTVRALIRADSDYIDPQVGAGKIERLRGLAPEVTSAGIVAMTDAGFNPGLQAVLFRYAATRMQVVEKAVVATGAFMDFSKVDGSQATKEEMVGGFASASLGLYRDGQWRPASAMSGVRVDFGEPLGVRKCVPVKLEEMVPLPAAYPSLRELTHVSCGFNKLTNGLVLPMVMLGERIAPGRLRRPLGALMTWSLRFTKPPFACVCQAELDGHQDGKPAQVLVRVSHADGYDLTAIPIVASVLQWLDGGLRQPGVHTLGNLVEPVRFVDDLERMGVQVTRSGGGSGT